MFPSQQEHSSHQHGYPDSHPPWAMHMQPVKIGDTYTKINNIITGYIFRYDRIFQNETDRK
jgi:hypothetical protein